MGLEESDFLGREMDVSREVSRVVELWERGRVGAGTDCLGS